MIPRTPAIVVAGALTALFALSAAACRRDTASPAADAGPSAKGDAVEFAAASPQLGEIRVSSASPARMPPARLTGRLAWNEDATTRVLPPVAGRIESLAPIGARVRRSDVLAELSSPDFGQAQADAVRASADLSTAERNRRRVERLFERGAAPRKDAESAEADLARARAEAERTSTRLERWGGHPGDSADERYVVRSPIEGIVVERTGNVGQECRPDAAQPLFVVTDPRRLWVFLDVTERDLPSVALGDRIEIFSTSYPERSFPGRIEWIGDSLDPATRTVRVRAGVEDPSRRLKAEMYVSVEVAAPAVSTLAVPATAVITDGARSFCFVQESPTRFRRIAIQVGPERGGRVPILSGLSPGARVVTEGSLLLASFLAEGRG
jgi:cobalt-zinc-cadmium efflux system membrane fusion protein